MEKKELLGLANKGLPLEIKGDRWVILYTKCKGSGPCGEGIAAISIKCTKWIAGLAKKGLTLMIKL